MKPLDLHQLASEIRNTTRDLRRCLADLFAENCSLLTALLRRFPTRIEALADAVAEPLAPEFAPPRSAPDAPFEANFAVLPRWLG